MLPYYLLKWLSPVPFQYRIKADLKEFSCCCFKGKLDSSEKDEEWLLGMIKYFKLFDYPSNDWPSII